MKLSLLLLLLLSLYETPKPTHFQKRDFIYWGFFKMYLFYFPSPNFRKILYAASMARGCACGQPEPQHCFQGNIAPHSPAENCYFYWHLCCSRIWKKAWRSFMAWSACSCCHWWKKTQINLKTAASVLCINNEGNGALVCCLTWNVTAHLEEKVREVKLKKKFFFISFRNVCNRYGRRQIFAELLLEEITDICVYCWVPS